MQSIHQDHPFFKNDRLWIANCDAISFLKQLPDHSVDLILVDPPFGLQEKHFDQNHYQRDEQFVLSGYQEAPDTMTYEDWVSTWISDFDRVLKPNGSLLIISGWTNEAAIQYAIAKTKQFRLINHLIWNFNFGVATKTKFVTSHYHILYYCKTKGKPYFNKYAYHNESHLDQNGRSLMYQDLQDVIKINKQYAPGQIKNVNSLPLALVEKLIKHTTKINDVVCDLFSGNWTTQKAALNLKRIAWGCEINPHSYQHHYQSLINHKSPYSDDLIALSGYQQAPEYANQSQPIDVNLRQTIISYYQKLDPQLTKKQKIATTQLQFKRGYWAIKRIIEQK